MRNILKVLLTTVLFTAFLFASQPEKISGDYLESRSADVYVAKCFANSEVGITGDQALLAWHVRNGSWDGQKLDGLNVIAAVKASATIGDPYSNPYPAKSVLLVDEQASAAQRAALISL